MSDKTQKTEPQLKEHVDDWAIMTRHDGTHYAIWAEDSTFETAATIDDKINLVVQRKEASKHVSVPIKVVNKLIELESFRLMNQRLSEQRGKS